MPYKDKEKQKEANKERQRKHRQGVTEGVTQDGVTEGVTRIEFIQQHLEPWTVEGIEQAAEVFDDRDIRYERAYIYKLKREGKVLGSIFGRGVADLQTMTGYYGDLLEATE